MALPKLGPAPREMGRAWLARQGKESNQKKGHDHRRESALPMALSVGFFVFPLKQAM